MKHGILFSLLFVLFTGTAGGVFVLVHLQPKPAPQEDTVLYTPQPTAKQITSSPTAPKPPDPSPLITQAPEAEKININTAGYEELQEITGVGPVLAQRIIDYRNQNGPFQTIEEIKNVKGIGDVTFEKMEDEITI